MPLRRDNSHTIQGVVYNENSHQLTIVIPRDESANITQYLGDKSQELGGKLEKLGDKARKLGDKLQGNRLKMLEVMLEDSTLTIVEIAERVGVSSSTIDNYLSSMRGKYVEREGANKNGRWRVLTD